VQKLFTITYYEIYIYIYTYIYIYILVDDFCGPGSSVGIATDYGLDGPGSNPGVDEISRPSRPVLGPTQPPVKWVKGKGKSVPLQAWTGPEGSSKLRLPDFVTTAQDGGKVHSLTPRPPLTPGNTPGTHFC